MSEDNKIYYANSVQFSVTLFDFMLDFGVRSLQNAESNEPEHNTSAIIVMSPQHAKVMAQLLNENVKRYEEVNGEIKIPNNLLNVDSEA